MSIMSENDCSHCLLKCGIPADVELLITSEPTTACNCCHDERQLLLCACCNYRWL